MSTNIDARGLACPQPVIATKKALDSIADGVVIILVDNVIAKDNIVKFATAHGCGVSIEEKEGYFSIKITKGIPRNADKVVEQSMAVGDIVYLISQDTLGHGNRELGAVLMKSFMYTLLETKPTPKAILFMNSGVLLTTQNSPVLEHLKHLAQDGVEILSCGTCLDYFKLKDKLAIGSVSNMYTIVETMSKATKVITL